MLNKKDIWCLLSSYNTQANIFVLFFPIDDGSISWEEFVSYFADGVMGKEEMQATFDEIDSHNTKYGFYVCIIVYVQGNPLIA